MNVETLAPADLGLAAAVLARGMRDNPIHVAVFGPDPEVRRRALEPLFRAVLANRPERPRVATRAGFVVGYAGASAPGGCMPPPAALARLAPAILRLGPGATRRALAWFRAWGERDPDTPHWHVGPVAVDGALQGMGIGGRLLADLAAHCDTRGEAAYLETDKAENVGFYQRFGFRVVDEADVLGVPNWFMQREPGGGVSPTG